MSICRFVGVFVAVWASFFSSVLSGAAELGTGTAFVRQVPAVNGGATVEGSLHVMQPGDITLNGGATITGDLLVPGEPGIRLNGKPNYGGTLVGTGPASPSGYTITLNGRAALRNVILRTAPVSLPFVPPSTVSSGTRDVVLSIGGQSVGDWATLRNLTLNSGVGQVAVTPGAYGDFLANGGSGFTLGVPGSTTPAVYHLRRLTLNGQARIDVVGPVMLTLAHGLSANGQLGSVARPDWLSLNIASGGLTLNGGCALHAFVSAPAPGTGVVLINGNSTLTGGLVADQLIINGGGLVRLLAGTSVPTNTAPIADSQLLSTQEDMPLECTLTATDAENDTLTYVLESLPQQGTLHLVSANAEPAPALAAGAVLSGTRLRYVPPADFQGEVSFSFRVRDVAGLQSNLATIAITVTSVNDVPAADPIMRRTLEDTPVEITLSGVDPEGSALVFDAMSTPANGSLTGIPPQLTYHPNPDFFGVDTFTYIATDAAGGASAPALVTITVDPVNDAPSARAQALELLEDESLLLVLSATDVEGDPLIYSLAETPAAGTLVLPDGSAISGLGHPLPTDPDGTVSLRYVPGPDRYGTDAFSFVANDGQGTSALASVTLIVRPVNDAPMATLVRPIASDRFIAPATILLQAEVTDIDGADDLVRVEFFVGE